MKKLGLFMIIAALAWSLEACSTSRNNTETDNDPVDTTSILPNDTTGMGIDTTEREIKPVDTSGISTNPIDTTGRRTNPL